MSNFTSQILSAEGYAGGLEIITNAQRYINKKDQALLLTKVSSYQYLHKIAECVGWKKLWDHALDHGLAVIQSMKNFVRVITYPDYATFKCPLCDIPDLDQVPLAEHLIINHTKSDNSWSTLFDSLITMDPSFFNHILCFFT